MIQSDVLFRELTSEELKALPREWIAIYLSRPKADRTETKKHMTWFRVAFIALLTVFAVLTHRFSGFVFLLLFLLLMYELAYQSSRNERDLLKWAADQDEYAAKVSELSGLGA